MCQFLKEEGSFIETQELFVNVLPDEIHINPCLSYETG